MDPKDSLNHLGFKYLFWLFAQLKIHFRILVHFSVWTPEYQNSLGYSLIKKSGSLPSKWFC